MNRKAWTPEELHTVLTEYACMLRHELSGEPYSKTAHRKAGLLTMDRTAGSWEMKCCNISAALRDAGRPWINGYKPLSGYQHCIRDLIDTNVYLAEVFAEHDTHTIAVSDAALLGQLS